MALQRRNASLVAVSALAFLAAAPSNAQSLKESLAQAYNTSPQIAAARANLRTLDEQEAINRSGFRPDVSSSVSYSLEYDERQSGGVPGGGGSNGSAPFRLSLDGAQNLYNGGQTTNSVESARETVRAGRENLISTEQGVLSTAAIAFLNVLRDREFVSLAENNVRVIAEQLQASRDRFEVGEITRTDVSQAEARLADARSDLAQRRGLLAQSERNYQQVVGSLPGALSDPPPLTKLPNGLNEAIEQARETNPDLRAARFNEAAARRDVRTAIGQLLPQLDLTGSLAYSDGDTSVSGFDGGEAQVGLVATIPLYQGGAAYAGVRQSQAAASQQLANIGAVGRDIDANTAIAWSDLDVARAAILAQRESVRANAIALDGVQQEALAGVRTTLDVLDAEQELLDARTLLVAAERDEYVAAINLLVAMGRFTAADLELPVDLYDPTIYHDSAQQRLFGFDRDENTEWEKSWRP